MGLAVWSVFVWDEVSKSKASVSNDFRDLQDDRQRACDTLTGNGVGALLGACVGLGLGATVGCSVGLADGDRVGLADGDRVGLADGDRVGLADGRLVGPGVGGKLDIESYGCQ